VENWGGEEGTSHNHKIALLHGRRMRLHKASASIGASVVCTDGALWLQLLNPCGARDSGIVIEAAP